VIRDLGSFTRMGLLEDLEHPGDIWWVQIADTAGGGRDRRGDGRRQKDHRPACDERVRGPKTQPLLSYAYLLISSRVLLTVWIALSASPLALWNLGDTILCVMPHTLQN